MLNLAVCSPPKNKTASNFTFNGFEECDESDLPDSLTEEGSIERNQVKTSFTENQIRNSPLSFKRNSVDFEPEGNDLLSKIKVNIYFAEHLYTCI